MICCTVSCPVPVRQPFGLQTGLYPLAMAKRDRKWASAVACLASFLLMLFAGGILLAGILALVKIRASFMSIFTVVVGSVLLALGLASLSLSAGCDGCAFAIFLLPVASAGLVAWGILAILFKGQWSKDAARAASKTPEETARLEADANKYWPWIIALSFVCAGELEACRTHVRTCKASAHPPGAGCCLVAWVASLCLVRGRSRGSALSTRMSDAVAIRRVGNRDRGQQASKDLGKLRAKQSSLVGSRQVQLTRAETSKWADLETGRKGPLWGGPTALHPPAGRLEDCSGGTNGGSNGAWSKVRGAFGH